MDMRLSIAIPYYKFPGSGQLLSRCLNSIAAQTFKDYEIVVTDEGKMAENTNASIRQSKGELIKILYMDDYLAHENALQDIANNFKGEWLVTGYTHTNLDQHNIPFYNDQIHTGKNTIGSPSVLTIKNGLDIYFDENLTWVLDCDFYRRLHDRYGNPTILDDINVVIGTHPEQASYKIPETIKQWEYRYAKEKKY